MTALLVAAMLAQVVPTGAAPQIARELSRLAGHRVTVAADGASYTLERVANEGRPVVGTIERRGASLYVRSNAATVRLAGPLARPRIAGPGYRVWVLGELRSGTLHARRLGVLSPPSHKPQTRVTRSTGAPGYGTNTSATSVAAKK